jgi:hypothetical protein
MRRVKTTSVNVQIDGRLDRTNVVATLRGNLRRLRLFLRGVCKALAWQSGQSWQRLQAMYAVQLSPSWGGHCLPGGSGTPRSS